MDPAEAHLVELIAPYQPELAPHLAYRIARWPAQRLQEVFTSAEALQSAINEALAQEFSQQHLTENAALGSPVAAQAEAASGQRKVAATHRRKEEPAWHPTAAPAVAAGASAPVAGPGAELAISRPGVPAMRRKIGSSRSYADYSDGLPQQPQAPYPEQPQQQHRQQQQQQQHWLLPPQSAADAEEDAIFTELMSRVAAIQPELAPQIVEQLLAFGDAVVAECLSTDSALQRRTEQALAQLFRAESDESYHQGDVKLFREGPGHGLAVEKQPARKAIGSRAHRPLAVAGPIESQMLALPLEQDNRAILNTSTARAFQHFQQAPGLQGVAPAPAASKRRVIPQLEEFLDRLNLGEYLESAQEWTAQMGAINLDEIVENVEDFAGFLQLKPLERGRNCLRGARPCTYA
eukprot:TRINITY_DN11589_c0_g1_i2.p1 TRINITY_DN11589_c0_g1~~TRINITY_DN11589_c0_g1_i2.p1  ORF type:complete len:406 (-),score=90.00 TRINITY_DN11589_c0_g1_i2:507-1724(-)